MTTEFAYSYTQDDINQALSEILEDTFGQLPDADEDPLTHQILVVAGVQGSGKTYLLENTLLKDPRYASYISPYRLEFREKHPQYQQMLEHGIPHAYEHTEGYIRELSGRLFGELYEKGHNLVMETTLHSPTLNHLPMDIAKKGYRFDLHVIGCHREFAHLSTIRRALKSLEKLESERFVEIERIDHSIANAHAVLTAFEEACTLTVGSEITLYERGFGELKDRRMVCRSICGQVGELTPQPINAADGTLIEPSAASMRIERNASANRPCVSDNFTRLVQTPIDHPTARADAWNDAYQALGRTRKFWPLLPQWLPDNLWTYLNRYAV